MEFFMRRKIIKQGVGGNTIFLPVKWIRERGLKPGDEVEILQEGSNLMIMSESNEEIKSVDINLDTVDREQIRSILASCYKSGYSKVRLIFNGEVPLEMLHKMMNSFTGFEIFSIEGKNVEINSFVRVSREDCEQLIKRMFHSTKYAFKMLLNEESDWKEIDTLVLNTIRRLRDHTIRSILLVKYGFDQNFTYAEIVTAIEKIAAGLSRYAKSGNNIGAKEMLDLFEELQGAYFKKDFIEAKNIWNKVHAFREKVSLELSDNKKIELSVFLAHKYHMSQLFMQLSSRIVSLYCKQEFSM